MIDQFKKGYKTTEFWITSVISSIPAFAFVATLFGYELDTEQLVVAVGALAQPLSYLFNRTWLKRKRIEGMALGIQAEALATAGTSPFLPQMPDSWSDEAQDYPADQIDPEFLDTPPATDPEAWERAIDDPRP